MFHHTVCAYANASANKGSERNFPVVSLLGTNLLGPSFHPQGQGMPFKRLTPWLTLPPACKVFIWIKRVGFRQIE